MIAPSVAVIDIGSNSIKLLVAARHPDGSPDCLLMRSIDARISAGLSGPKPALGADGMARGLAAIQELLVEAGGCQSPARPTMETVLVATSAVREAANGPEFCARIKAATGHPVRILSGEEEATYIGQGLVSDPALSDLRDFYVFDLGGGSLECLSFRDNVREQAVSLPLGCVRLMEKFSQDRDAPLNQLTLGAIDGHVRAGLRDGPFSFNLPATATAIGTGGTLSTVRFIEAAKAGVPFETTSQTISVDRLRELLRDLAVLPLEERRLTPGLPPARADVFPTALATVIALAEAGGFNAYRNSLRNLRWGIAVDSLR